MHADDQKYYESQEFRQLLQRYETAKEQGQSLYLDVDELADLCDYYTQMQADIDKAREVVDMALLLHPEATLTKVLNARLLMAAGQVEEAIEISKSIGETDDREALFLHAELLIMQEKSDEALHFIMELADGIDEDLDYFIYDSIQIFLDHELYSQATVLLQRLETLAPDWYKTWLSEADVLLCQDKYQQALPYIERMLDVDPFDIEVWNWSAEAYYNLERYDEALTSTDYALAIEPHSQRSLLLKAWALMRVEREDEAHDILTQLEEETPDDAHYWLADAYALNELKRWDEVIDAIDHALTCPNADTASEESTRELYAHAHARLGKLSKALAIVEQMEQDKTEASTSYNCLRAELYVESLRPEKASVCLQRAIDEEPDREAEFLDAIAYYLYELDLTMQAVPLLQRQLALTTDTAQGANINTRLAACYLAKECYIAALPYLQAALQQGATNLREYLEPYFPSVAPADYYNYCYYFAYGRYPD